MLWGMFWGRIMNKNLDELCLILLMLIYFITKATAKFVRLAWLTYL